MAASRWLQRFGLEANEHNTMIAAGAQNALATILSSLFEAGDRIAVDTYTYPNFISLANQLYLQLVPIENDVWGMRPDQLENVCTLQKIKGVYMMPAGGNPTNIAFSDSRKREIAEIIRKQNLISIEDDNYAALLETPYSPLALEATEHCIYVSGLSKPLCPGIRIAYLYLPDQYINAMEQGMFSQNLKISSLNMEIAAEIIRSGLAWKIIQKKRAAAAERNQIYASFFPDRELCMESYYQWLELPEHLTGRLCEAELSGRGVSVFGAERFYVGKQLKANAVRVATSSAESDEQLRRGLEVLQNFIRQRDAGPLFIV